jgi:von Willebrand factor type D domain
MQQSISVKCGKTVYNCGQPPKSHACLMPGAATTTAGDGATCKRFLQAIKSKSIFTDETLCPISQTSNQATMVTYYAENIVGAGRLCSPSLCKKCTSAKCGGDPHFMTYDGTSYTYHGQCDLLMAKSNDLDGTGLTLDVHARTTIKADWSYVSNAAVKIGNDVLEITTDTNATHYFNGEANVDFPIAMADKYVVRKQRVEAFPGEYRTDYMIDLKDRDDGARERGDFIHIRYFKEMLTIDVEAQLHDSMGMLGVSGEEGLIQRDLVTPIVNGNTAQMGLEWQVRDTEAKLFHDKNRAPQYPTQCILPKVVSRRLRAQSADESRRATEACSQVDSTMKEFCIHDVMLTGDVQVAHMYTL